MNVWILAAIVSGLLRFHAPALAQSVATEGRWVVTGKDVVGIAPPSLVAAPDASNVSWSPTGRYVCAVRTSMRLTGKALKSMMAEIKQGTEPKRPAGEIAVVVWSAATQQTTEVWKRPVGVGSVQELRWIPGSDIALARVTEDIQMPSGQGGQQTERRETLIRINAELGAARAVIDVPRLAWLIVESSPTQPVVLLRYSQIEDKPRPGSDRPQVHEVLCALRENGRPGSPIEVPAEYTLAAVQWSEDGGTPILMLRDRAASATAKKAVFRWYRLDPAGARVTALPGQPQLYRPKPGPINQAVADLALSAGVVTAEEGDASQAIKLLWLAAKEKSDLPRALVASDCTMGWLSPPGDAILYLQNGSAWVAPLFRIDRQTFEEMRDRARRMVALSNGKQLALGLLMYSQDFDNKMPAAGEDVNALIGPYLKNDAVFAGFVYTFAGGKLSDYSEPANTEIGYVTGPGGRAIMYLDGHVKWQDNR